MNKMSCPAIVLCLAPMALMVGAAENDIAPYGIHCACNPTTYDFVDGINPTYTYDVPNANACYIQYYEVLVLRCRNCHIPVRVEGGGREIAHPTFVLTEVNGEWVYQCPNCHYVR